MKIEQQMFRDQLAVELVKLLANNVTGFDTNDIVHSSFELADLTVERITKDLLAAQEVDKQQSVEEALIKAEQKAEAMAKMREAEQEAANFEERRKGGGINVIETDDLREVLDILRSVMGRK